MKPGGSNVRETICPLISVVARCPVRREAACFRSACSMGVIGANRTPRAAPCLARDANAQLGAASLRRGACASKSLGTRRAKVRRLPLRHVTKLGARLLPEQPLDLIAGQLCTLRAASGNQRNDQAPLHRRTDRKRERVSHLRQRPAMLRRHLRRQRPHAKTPTLPASPAASARKPPPARTSSPTRVRIGWSILGACVECSRKLREDWRFFCPTMAHVGHGHLPRVDGRAQPNWKLWLGHSGAEANTPLGTRQPGRLCSSKPEDLSTARMSDRVRERRAEICPGCRLGYGSHPRGDTRECTNTCELIPLSSDKYERNARALSSER